MLKRVQVAFLIIMTGNLLILAGVPPVSRDALTHHLAVPKLYLAHGGIQEIPHLVFSYYPMALDLLYMISLYFGSDIAAKYIHMIFGLWTAFLIYRFLSVRVSSGFAWLGPIFFLTIPVVVKLSVTVYVDLGLVFFSTASLLFLLKFRETQFQVKFLVFSALCAGLAMGVKYNGLVTLFVMVMLTVLVHQGGSPRSLQYQCKSFGLGVLFAFIAILVFSPWMVRNYIWTGNPVYPLYDRVLNFREGSDLLQGGLSYFKHASSDMGNFSMRRLVMGESIWEILSIPVRMFFQGEDDSPRYFDGRLSPFLLALPFLTLFFSSHRRKNGISEEGVLALYSIIYILVVFFKQDMRIRWISPSIPPLVILSVTGLSRMHRYLCRYGPFPAFGVVCIVVVLMIGGNLSYVLDLYGKIRPLDYISGRLSREDYIKRYRPEYSTLLYVNRNLEKDARIISLFLGHRFYYSDRTMIPGNSVFTSVVKESSSISEITRRLYEMNITHLMVGTALFAKWGMVRMSGPERKMVITFFERCPLLYRKDGYGLYALDFHDFQGKSDNI